MRGGVAGRTDGRGALQAGDNGAVGGSAVGLVAVGSRALPYCIDGFEVDCEGSGQELFENIRFQEELYFRKEKDS